MQLKISIKKTGISFFIAIKHALFYFALPFILHFWCTEKMNKFLSTLEAPQHQKLVIDESKLRYYITKISQFGTIFVFQNMLIKIFLLRKEKACLIDVTMSFMKCIMVQVTLSFLFCCFYVCCLRYFA